MRKYNLYCAFFVRGANYESKEDYFYRIGCSFANGVVFARDRGLGWRAVTARCGRRSLTCPPFLWYDGGKGANYEKNISDFGGGGRAVVV